MREINSFHPTGWDQIVYYNSTFTIYDAILNREWNGFINTLIPQGNGLQILTALSYFIFGIHRINGSLIIFIVFLLCQYKIYQFTLNRVGSYVYASIAMMLMSCCATYYFIIGGVFDFRLDLIGGMIYGISLIYLIEGLDKDNLSQFVFISIVAVIFRTNLLIIYAPIVLILLIMVAKQKKLRIIFNKTNILSIIILIITMLPIIKGFMIYYGIIDIFQNNGINKELLRTMNEVMQVDPSQTKDFYLYYVKSFLQHIGEKALSIIGVLCIMYYIYKDKRNKNKLFKYNIMILSFILTPFLLYTFNPSKNPVVATTMIIPFIIGIIVNIICKIKTYNKYISILLMGLVIFNIIDVYTMSINSSSSKANEISNRINEIATLYGKKDINISFLDYNEINTELISYYNFLDKKNKIINYKTILPQGYNIPTKKDVIRGISESDIVVINEVPEGELFASNLSFNNSIYYFNEISEPYLEKSFIKDDEAIETSWGKYRVYYRPHVKVINAYGDWLGETFAIEIDQADEVKKITLNGSFPEYIPYQEIYLNIKISDEDTLIKEENKNIKCEDGKYKIEIGELDIYAKQVYINISSTEYFIPKELGINEDERKLVIPYPQQVNVIMKD
jgi:hypothetical protein